MILKGGSELAINARAGNAVIVTNMAASIGGVTWVLTEMVLKRSVKMSLYGFCNGAVSGLVAITPAAGFVTPASSLVFGALAGPVCLFGCKIKKLKKIRFDDACDVFGSRILHIFEKDVLEFLFFLFKFMESAVL